MTELEALVKSPGKKPAQANGKEPVNLVNEHMSPLTCKMNGKLTGTSPNNRASPQLSVKSNNSLHSTSDLLNSSRYSNSLGTSVLGGNNESLNNDKFILPLEGNYFNLSF